MKKFITRISNYESKQMEALIEKGNSLNGLIETLNENIKYIEFKNKNINKIKNEQSEINLKIKQWWNDIFSKYELKEIEGYVYSVVCKDESIYLIKINNENCKGCL